MNNYQVIDLATWPRRTHWQYYRNIVKAAIAMTKKIDVTNVLKYCHRTGRSFSAVFLYVISRTVNSMECMRMCTDGEGNPAVWDVIHPNFTIFHKDDETFSDVWMEYYPEMEDFLANYEKVLEEYGNKRGIKVRDNQPPNFFPVSGLPWISYESMHTYTQGTTMPPALFPILNYGKYEEVDGRFLLPFSITIAHAAMDGYHVAKFFEKLQEMADSVGNAKV